VLFYFCSDLCISAIRARYGSLLSDLTHWTLLFLRDRVSAWVHSHGGWQRVLHQGLGVAQQLAVIVACTAVATAAIIYIGRRRT
jgi:hypothetical protein